MAEPECLAVSSTGTSAGRGSEGHGRWGGCAAGQRRDRLTRCSPRSLRPSLRWEAGAERRQTLTLTGVVIDYMQSTSCRSFKLTHQGDVISCVRV